MVFCGSLPAASSARQRSAVSRSSALHIMSVETASGDRSRPAGDRPHSGHAWTGGDEGWRSTGSCRSKTDGRGGNLLVAEAVARELGRISVGGDAVKLTILIAQNIYAQDKRDQSLGGAF